MTTEELETVLGEVYGRGEHLNWLQIIILFVVTSIAAFVGAYFKKTGENLATHNDIDKLTSKVESIKNDYQKDLENFKDSLFRKKIIFEKHIEAYNKLKGIKYMIMPIKSHPEYDYSDALEDIARDLHKYSGYVKNYLIQYSGIIPEPVIKKLESCLHYCEEGKFEVTAMDVDIQGIEMAKLFWNSIISAQDCFAKHLDI